MDFKQVFKKLTFQKIFPPPPLKIQKSTFFVFFFLRLPLMTRLELAQFYRIDILLNSILLF